MAAKPKPSSSSSSAPVSACERVRAAMDPCVHAMLWQPLDVQWRHAPTAPKDPVRAKTAKSWKVYDLKAPPLLKKREKNWFYADLVFPERHHGVALAGTDAMFDINGYCPFTLWIDGVEMFKEEHVWMATGPISEPAVLRIEPGRKHRLVVCLEPTELPALGALLVVLVLPRAVWTLGVELSAALAQLHNGEQLASTDEERALVQAAAAQVDLAALKAHRYGKLLASIAAMESTLAPLSAKAKARTVHLIGHTHIDMDWMWTWKDTVHCVRRDFKSVTDLMDDYPELTFTHSQVPTYQIVQEQDPDIFAKVQAHVASGRWEVAAATWVEGDLAMSDGEAIARSQLYADAWCQEHLGATSRIYWAPDNFVHPGNMPQLARLAGRDSYFQWRCNPGRDDNWPIRVWEADDGTPIVSFASAYGGGLFPQSIAWQSTAAGRSGLTDSFHIWGLGDHGGGLQRRWLETMPVWRDKPLIPTVVFSTMQRLMTALEPQIARMPRNRGETYSLFEGCFTTHARIKRYNRECETALLSAEALCARAGLDRREALRGAWTPMLFNEFHDILCGAAVHDSYIDAYRRAEATLKTAGAIAAEAAAALAGGKPGGKASGSTLALVNPHGFAVTAPVEVDLPAGVEALVGADGAVVPAQRSGKRSLVVVHALPAFAAVSWKPAKAATAETPVQVVEDATSFRVETRHAVLRIHKASGVIGSYVDKALKRELVAYGVNKTLTHVPSTRADLALNVFQIIDEAPNTMSAWLINDPLREESLLRGAETRLIEAGPVFARFRVTHRFRSSRIDEDIVVWNDLGRVDFTATVDWREQGSSERGVPQLKVSFATAMSAARARFDGPYATPERPADGQEQPTQKWTDLTGDGFGFALLNSSQYGCDALGGRLRLTLLRNSYGPDPESDNGTHVLRFAFMPHAAALPLPRIIEAGAVFNRPPLAARTAQPPSRQEAWLRIDGADAVVCTALRLAERTDHYVLRLHDTSGAAATARITLGERVAEVVEADLLERPLPVQGARVVDGAIQASFRGHEVKTLLVLPE